MSDQNTDGLPDLDLPLQDTDRLLGSRDGVILKKFTWAGLKAQILSLFSTVAVSGSYADLSDQPTLFSGSYTDLTSQPTLFSGSYSDLTNKPTIPATKADIGLGNVDNTSDSNKPISTAVQTALNSKQNTLTAGPNISIVGNLISATAGSSLLFKDEGVALGAADATAINFIGQNVSAVRNGSQIDVTLLGIKSFVYSAKQLIVTQHRLLRTNRLSASSSVAAYAEKNREKLIIRNEKFLASGAKNTVSMGVGRYMTSSLPRNNLPQPAGLTTEEFVLAPGEQIIDDESEYQWNIHTAQNTTIDDLVFTVIRKIRL